MGKGKEEALQRGGLFIPLIFSFAAKLQDTPLPQFLKDPTKIANALRTIRSYYQCQGVICYYDPTVEAEALGCELDWNTYPPEIKRRLPLDAELKSRVEKIAVLGRIPTALEVVRRLNVMLRDVILMATVTGPVTIACYLSGQSACRVNRELLDLASKATLNLTRGYGEVGLDILLVVEEEFPECTDEVVRTLKVLYSPIWNTAKFYGMEPVLMVKNIISETPASVSGIADCLITRNLSLLTETPIRRIGYAIPVSSLVDPPSAIRSRLEMDLPPDQLKSGKILLITTDDEIPQNIDKESLIKGIRVIQDYVEATL